MSRVESLIGRMTLTEKLGQLTMTACGQAVTGPTIAGDSTEAIKSAVEVGLGVGLVSQWALRESNIGALAVVPLANLRIRRDFDFAYPQGPAPSGLAGLFMEFAAEFGARMPPPSAALERANRPIPARPSLL